MREILFRGKKMCDGEWVYGDYHKYTCTTSGTIPTPTHYIMGTDASSKLQMWVDHSTVGQYTGLKDSSGKKIFEGDILKWDEREWGDPHFEVVMWDYDLFVMRAKDWNEFCVVCGNIHDNTELLEKKEA